MDPPYHAHAFEGALAVIYNAGTKENAGIFSQSQGWIILAEALRGHGCRAEKGDGIYRSFYRSRYE